MTCPHGHENAALSATGQRNRETPVPSPPRHGTKKRGKHNNEKPSEAPFRCVKRQSGLIVFNLPAFVPLPFCLCGHYGLMHLREHDLNAGLVATVKFVSNYTISI